MSTDAKPADPVSPKPVSPVVQQHVDDFKEKIEAGTADLKAWLEHALEHGTAALKAAHPDVKEMQAALDPFAAEIIHAWVGGLPEAFVPVEPLLTDIATLVLNSQLEKLAAPEQAKN